jgi:hypothetical protein
MKALSAIPVLVLIFSIFPLHSWAQGPLRDGFTRDDLSFPFQWKANPLRPGVVLDEVIDLDPFDAPGKSGADFTEFRIIFGQGSLSIFDALGVDEVAGLKRSDAMAKIRLLEAEGKTERDGAFIAGLTNIHGRQIFMFFNLNRLAFSTEYAIRVLSHEPVHLARYLITQEAKPDVDYYNDPYATLNDENEEYFAESIERLTTLALDRYFKATLP